MKRSLTTFCVSVALAAGISSAALAQEADYLAICDQVIASRQPVPDLYRRLSYTFEEHKLSWDEHAKELERLGASSNFVARNKEQFEAGTYTPTDIKMIIDFEATDKTAAVIKKRSLCEYRMNSPTGKPSLDIVRVDGKPQAVWEAQR